MAQSPMIQIFKDNVVNLLEDLVLIVKSPMENLRSCALNSILLDQKASYASR